MIVALETSPTCGACAGGKGENKSADRDCESRSSENGITKRSFTKVESQNTHFCRLAHVHLDNSSRKNLGGLTSRVGEKGWGLGARLQKIYLATPVLP